MNSRNGPKRVLISTDAVGGVWCYTAELVRALSRRHVEVEVAVLGPAPTAEQAETVVSLPRVHLHETGLPLDWTAQEPSALSFASSMLASLAQQLGVDTIQLHTPALAAQPIWHAPVLAVIHSCVGTWWEAVRQGAPPADFLWRVAAVHAGLKAADVVVAPTHAFAELVRSTYGLHRPIAVVHNGRVPSHLDPRDGSTRHGVLAAGRLWDEGKNITLLDRAAALMGDVPVMAAGATNGPQGASATLAHLLALGFLSEKQMAKTMAEARVFAAPSLYEPFGLAVLEAAQTNLPLVLADIPSFRELWDGAAIFLPPHSAEVWAAILVALHAEPAACRGWGMKARARAATFTVERFDGAMWEKHCELIERGPRATAVAA
jgi:glycosyltransferase involved in cell wall biosynthesis